MHMQLCNSNVDTLVDNGVLPAYIQMDSMQEYVLVAERLKMALHDALFRPGTGV